MAHICARWIFLRQLFSFSLSPLEKLNPRTREQQQQRHCYTVICTIFCTPACVCVCVLYTIKEDAGEGEGGEVILSRSWYCIYFFYYYFSLYSSSSSSCIFFFCHGKKPILRRQLAREHVVCQLEILNTLFLVSARASGAFNPRETFSWKNHLWVKLTPIPLAPWNSPLPRVYIVYCVEETKESILLEKVAARDRTTTSTTRAKIYVYHGALSNRQNMYVCL